MQTLRMQALGATVELVTETCCNCGVLFAFTREHYNEFRKDPRKFFFCPNGHSQHYTVSTEAQLRQQLEDADRKIKSAQADLLIAHSAHQSTLHQLRGVKADRTRILKRVQNGVCPVCKRHFCDLEKHMKGQHPSTS